MEKEKIIDLINEWCEENSWEDSVPKNTFPNAESKFKVIAVHELVEFLEGV